MNSELALLDVSGISFPSDNLTIKTFRKNRSMLFDVGFDKHDPFQPIFFFEPLEAEHVELIVDILHSERAVAVDAYAKAAGIPDEDLRDLGFDPRENLKEQYLRFEIATGPAHAEELIRDIERQATALSQQVQR